MDMPCSSDLLINHLTLFGVGTSLNKTPEEKAKKRGEKEEEEKNDPWGQVNENGSQRTQQILRGAVLVEAGDDQDPALRVRTAAALEDQDVWDLRLGSDHLSEERRRGGTANGLEIPGF